MQNEKNLLIFKNMPLRLQYMSMNLRKNVEELTDIDLTNLRFAFNGLMQIRDNRGYNHIAGYHGVPGWFCWHHMQRTRAGIGRPLRLFLPWHRAYLYWLEQFLKDIREDVNLTWWNWASNLSRTRGLPAAFADEYVGGLPNPLYKARIFASSENQLPVDYDTTRSPGNPWELPTYDWISQCLSLSDFEDFEFFLENYLHDNIHGWVGGSMAVAAWSAYDPIFWAHHCMVDRIWYFWQKRYGNSSGLEDMFNEVLEPFPLTVRQVLDIHQLGYDYALASSGVEI